LTRGSSDQQRVDLKRKLRVIEQRSWVLRQRRYFEQFCRERLSDDMSAVSHTFTSVGSTD
jgi:hypothetical protein